MSDREPEGSPAVDIAQVRTVLGEFWGLGRAATLTELAGVLRMRGDSALQTATAWEISGRPPSGPVTLALELMTPPDEAAVAQIAADLCEIRLGPALPYPKLGKVLSFGGCPPQETMALIVRHVAQALLAPPGLEAAIGGEPTESADRQARMYRATARVRERARRPAPQVVRIAPKKIPKKIPVPS